MFLAPTGKISSPWFCSTYFLLFSPKRLPNPHQKKTWIFLFHQTTKYTSNSYTSSPSSPPHPSKILPFRLQSSKARSFRQYHGDSAGGSPSSCLMRVKGAALRAGKLSDSGVRKVKRGDRRKLPPPSQMPTAVMRLYRACRDVFSSASPGVALTPEDVERIRTVLDKMKPTDVNLTRNMPYFENNDASGGAAPVTYLHIYECDKFSIGIFCLPPAAIIPLHNHPGMTVFSKLLFGSMHIKSYDWVDSPENSSDTNDPTYLQSSGPRLAKVVSDTVFKAPCNASILYPNSGGNMHCFTALTSCAVLDVLGPPYNDDEGRHCQYYTVHPPILPGEAPIPIPANGGEYARLGERERPEDFVVLGGKYMGPKIVVQ